MGGGAAGLGGGFAEGFTDAFPDLLAVCVCGNLWGAQVVCGGEGVLGVCECLPGGECGLPERIGAPQAFRLPAIGFCDLARLPELR